MAQRQNQCQSICLSSDAVWAFCWTPEPLPQVEQWLSVTEIQLGAGSQSYYMESYVVGPSSVIYCMRHSWHWGVRAAGPEDEGHLPGSWAVLALLSAFGYFLQVIYGLPPSLLPIGMIIVTVFHSQCSGIGGKGGHPASPDSQKPNADSVLHKSPCLCKARAGGSHSEAEGKVCGKGSNNKDAWPRHRSHGSEGVVLFWRSGHCVQLKQTSGDSSSSQMNWFVLNIVLKCSGLLLLEHITESMLLI